MAKKPAAAFHSNPAPPPPAAAPEADEDLMHPAPSVPTGGVLPSQMSMVREALKELGAAAKAAEVGEFIKAKYGADVFNGFTSAKLSNYTSQLRSKVGGASRKPPQPRGAAGRSAAAAVAADDAERAAKGGISSDLAALSSLIGKHGADEVKKLVDLLAK